MVTEKIKRIAEMDYEWTLELAKFVDRMLNDMMNYDRTIVTHFLTSMHDKILNSSKILTDAALIEACKPYFEVKT